MRSLLRVLTYLFGLSLPLLAYGQGILGPVVPDVSDANGNLQTCAAGWQGVLIVAGGLVNLVVYAGVTLAAIVMVYGGFILLVNSTSPEGLGKGKRIIGNAAVGLVIALGAWLMVNLMLTELGAGDVNSLTAVLGTGGDLCIPVRPLNAPSYADAGDLGDIPLLSGTGSCDPIAVKAAAAAGGYAISDKWANTFACLAKPESSCGTNTTGARTPSGQLTSAAGPWQNLLSFKDKCHSLTIPACGNLNCSAAYSGGTVKPDAASQALARQCHIAINNLTCAAAAAACLNQASGGNFSPWTADSRSSKQKQCIQHFNGG